jgi:hypothetical protein
MNQLNLPLMYQLFVTPFCNKILQSLLHFKQLKKLYIKFKKGFEKNIHPINYIILLRGFNKIKTLLHRLNT